VARPSRSSLYAKLFAIGGDRAAYHQWQGTINGNWSGWDGGLWHPFQHNVTQLGAANSRTPDLNVIQLFAIDDIGAVHRIRQTLANNGWQKEWVNVLPPRFIQLAAVSQLEGKMGVFALRDDGTIFWTTLGAFAQLP
jgi:hypothetical protein